MDKKKLILCHLVLIFVEKVLNFHVHYRFAFLYFKRKNFLKHFIKNDHILTCLFIKIIAVATSTASKKYIVTPASVALITSAIIVHSACSFGLYFTIVLILSFVYLLCKGKLYVGSKTYYSFLLSSLLCLLILF